MASQMDTIINSEVFETIKPIITLGRISGVCPITYKLFGSQYFIKQSKMFVLYSYALALTLGLASIIGIIKDIQLGPEESFRMTNQTEKYIVCVDFAVAISIVIIAVLTSRYKFNYLSEIFNKIYEIDRYIPSRISNKIRQYNIFAITTVMVLFIMLTITDISLWITANTMGKKTAKVFLTNYLAFYLIYCLLIGQELYYWFIMDLIRRRFQNFGYALQSKITTFAILTIHRPIEFILDNPKIVKEIFTEKYAKNLTKTHQLLCETMDNLVAYCSFPILMLVIGCLLHLIITPYFLFGRLEEANTVSVIVQFAWIFTHMFRLFILVEPCHSSTDTNKKNLNLVYKILRFDLTKNARNQFILLTQQISKRSASFSACGLFSIDRTILTTIAGTITTYLVILFQVMRK